LSIIMTVSPASSRFIQAKGQRGRKIPTGNDRGCYELPENSIVMKKPEFPTYSTQEEEFMKQQRILPVQSFSVVTLAIAVLVLAVTASTSVHAQTFSVLHDFLGGNSADGCNPTYSGIVAQGRDGNMYGTTENGGAPSFTNNVGTVFQVTPAGALNVIYSFPSSETEGWLPFSGLTLGTDGNFYGTTYYYGLPENVSYFGSVFQITPGGSRTYLYKFTGGSDGRYPTAPPIQGTDGNWYGTTQGDPRNPGSVYRLTPSGQFKSLHQFVLGEMPEDPLVLATDGNFYGTTTGGGSASGGVVFKLTSAGKITVLNNFVQGDTPSVPIAGLVQATDGYLYGTTGQGNSQGGTTSNGTVFRMKAIPSTPSYLHDFDQYPTGSDPQDTLLQHTNGILYGDTISGGVPNVGCGVFYSWNQGLKPFVSLLSTSGKVGDHPNGILGQGFTGASAVFSNGVSAAFTLDTTYPDTYLTATVPSGATKGNVTVVTPTGTLTSNKVFTVVPALLSFSPTSGTVGTSVVITGSGLTQASKVTFGGVKATAFIVNSDSQVTATVPTGAKTGKIAITTPAGTATSAKTFTVLP
jgi:uncharacterized repeat protein (TIGR03803 family)